MRAVRVVLILAVALLLALPVMAQDKKRERKRGPGGFDFVEAMLRDLNLSDEQKAKVEDVRKEFAPKVEEARKKTDVLTDDQRKARDEAEKKAKEEGKTRGEIRAAGIAAVTLSDEQKAKLGAALKEFRSIREQERAKIMEILTPEQKAEAEKRWAEIKKKIEGWKKGAK